MAQFEVTGLAGVSKRLQVIADPAFERTARREALVEGARVLKAAVEENAPTAAIGPTENGTSLEPGELKANIGISLVEENDKSVALVGPNRNVAHVARWLEYGHRLVKGGRNSLNAKGRLTGPGTQVGFVPAHPFIRSAGERAGSEAVDVFKLSFAQKVLDKWRSTNG